MWFTRINRRKKFTRIDNVIYYIFHIWFFFSKVCYWGKWDHYLYLMTELTTTTTINNTQLRKSSLALSLAGSLKCRLMRPWYIFLFFFFFFFFFFIIIIICIIICKTSVAYIDYLNRNSLNYFRKTIFGYSSYYYHWKLHTIVTLKKWVYKRVYTFVAASRINCLAASDHIAGTVNTQWISSSVRVVFVLVSAFKQWSFRYRIDSWKTVFANISLPLPSFIHKLRWIWEKKKERKKERKKNRPDVWLKDRTYRRLYRYWIVSFSRN